MLKKVLFFFSFLFLAVFNLFAQLQSPEQFLGYKIGERFTPHHKIVDYYRHVAQAVPTQVKLQSYGKTYEGRELLVAYVSAPQHIANLESIRTNNLSLAQQGASGTTASMPALVWLSYNVHGNEASSSEASLMTLYELVNPANTQTKTWLQNTVVVLDPCLNPDGRDRYVNWFNSVVGKNANPLMAGREHFEPWPGGRPNHYYFDLNRDWAWQTQIETQQRVALYNQWLPQVHVDFHEQGINSPYYFAPAAEPFHEAITPWQRSFQETIGRNHAKYFDKEGWLYFTKESFDLLYPAYGDTYPTYTGSIGMTYEQAGGGGGGRSGAAVIIATGDTLTLHDRALHHHTTGLSTVEVASLNAAKLLSEFQQFYKGTVQNGAGIYKSYVIKYAPGDAQRLQSLLTLMQKNGIKVTRGKGNGLRGYNYSNGKEESFSIAENDIVISTQQPKGVLVNVLFEPKTKLIDSATYDITAWSLPYVYGLNAFATRQAVAAGSEVAPITVNNPVTDAYGYVIRWEGVPSVKLATALAQKGIQMRFNEEPFTAAGQEFGRGAIMILKTGNQYYSGLWDTVRQMANRAGVQLTAVTSGWVDKGYDFGSSRVRPLHPRKVAVLVGEGVSSIGAGEVWHFFDQQLDYPVTLINTTDMARVDWKNFDVLVMPDGRYNFLTDKTAVESFRSWISGGGNVVALEGAVAQLARLDWTIKSKKEDSNDTKDPYDAVRRYENRERDYISGTTPGSIYKVALDNSHPLGFGYPNYYYTLKQDGAIYEFIKEGGWNVGVLKKDNNVAGFVGTKLANRLQDGMLFGTQEIGSGNITYLTDDVLFRSFWQGGKLMFCNAVFLVGQ